MFRKKHTTRDIQEDGTVHQEAKINELRAAMGPLSGRSLKYCTDACLRRYLEARNWNVYESKKMLEEMLKWRSTYKPEEIRWHEVAIEGETGKLYIANFHDREGRTVLVMKPAKQNSSSHINQIRHLVYILENAILNMPEGQEQMVCLIDFTGWSLSNSVPIKTAREAAKILQNHYPERLAAAFLYNPPRIFETFWKIVKYFLDPKSFEKTHFVYPKTAESIELMCKYFDVEILPVEFGGKNKIQYNHEEFSKLMLKDDIRSASIWDLNEKPAQANHTTNGHSTSEVAWEPSRIAAQAS
ncbi:phosphatidylinositol transfer protein 3-like isoform X2 [Phoenix dactylifera]|nr:phosphatidylinositol transfer protein 3-like isoform X2 [Phoenix dactylifera]